MFNQIWISFHKGMDIFWNNRIKIRLYNSEIKYEIKIFTEKEGLQACKQVAGNGT